jgi:DNA-binding CsgD family transcriptional regulator
VETKPQLKLYKRWTDEERGFMLMCIAYGYTNVETAKELDRTLQSVETELKYMRGYYGAHTTPHLIYLAIKEGLIDIDNDQIQNPIDENMLCVPEPVKAV